ncbi:MAG: LamG domain-containing protein [Phycisphaerales bacterium]|nr:MAG: LamG domain-containing protein [Phycisphaerales bacterium]
MCRKLIFITLALVLCLMGAAQGADIILISDADAPGGGDYHDSSFVTFLESIGHTVDTSGMSDQYRDGQDPFNDPTKVAALENADLVIVSRRTDSGSYDENTQNWNELQTPILLMSGYLTRDSRWNWTPGGSADAGNTATDIIIEPGQGSHPFLAGLSSPIEAFDWSTAPGGVCPKGVYLPSNDFVTGTILIGRFDGRPMLADIPAGTTLNNGNVTGERRAFLGHWGYDTGTGGPGGTYSEFEHYLTDDFKTLLANMIAEMVGIKQAKARNPRPEDGALHEQTSAVLTWTAGAYASNVDGHHVYFGDDLDDVSDGTGDADKGLVSWEQYLAADLEPGMTYYWRIDEVNDANAASPWKGDVWSFNVPPERAYEPSPADVAEYVDPDADLNWAKGLGAILHHVYLGTSFDAVNDADQSSAGIYRGPSADPTFDPGTLAKDTTYYWRIDEFTGSATHPGQVWSFSTIPTIPIDDPHLVGWWTFDEGSSTMALDWSGHDHHGVVNGEPQPVDGYHAGALALDGSNDNIFVETISAPTTAFTLALWFNSDVDLDASSSRRDFMYWLAPARPHFTFNRSGNGEIAIWPAIGGDFDGPETATSSWAAGTWYHIAATFDGTTFKVYVNAQEDASLVHPGEHDAADSLFIGSNRSNGNFFGGMIDDVRIYDVALSDVELQQVMRGDPKLAWAPSPANGSAPDIEGAIPLSWSPGDEAAQHDVYFGADRDAVDGADTTTAGIYRGRQSFTTYNPPEVLEWGRTYYWRIDEYNTDTTITTGRLWSFTVQEYLIVDDFEDYNDYSHRIFQTWIDGFGYTEPPPGMQGNGTGSTVGYLEVPYAETIIVNTGAQSMPMDYSNVAVPFYSEAERTWATPQNWTRHGVKALTLYFRGYPVDFVEGPAGTYTMSAAGTDIIGAADEFRFAYKMLSGDGSIEAQVLSVEDVNPWTKAGVMIRQSTDPGSKFAALYITPGNGCRFQIRDLPAGDASSDTPVTQLADIEAPHWIKIERTGTEFRAYDSNDPATEGWHPLVWNPRTINMPNDVLIGLCLTSHQSGVSATAVFSDVTTSASVTGAWTVEVIGAEEMPANDMEPLYVGLQDSTGAIKTVPHKDPAAAGYGTFQPWNVALSEFTGVGGVNLAAIKKMYIGAGNRMSPAPGGEGTLYIDDIRLYRPRCVPSELKPANDLSDNCVVDYADIEIMAGEWLGLSIPLSADLDGDDDVDFADYAELADTWLDELLWPAP